MRFQITTEREFSASHQLRLGGGTLEPLHGHNWRVKVTVGADKLDGMGLVMDFHELEKLVDSVIGPMHNRHLNDLAAFARANPSAENLAVEVAAGLKLEGAVRLVAVEVWETSGNSAVFMA